MNCDWCGKHTIDLSGFCSKECENHWYGSVRSHEEQHDEVMS